MISKVKYFLGADGEVKMYLIDRDLPLLVCGG